MFEQLFPGPKAQARQRDGPLAEQRRDYLTHLVQQGMSRATLLEAGSGFRNVRLDVGTCVHL
jgi:hypothetical protein